MDSNVKDWFDVLSKGTATVGGLIAAFIAVFQIRQNRLLRARDLRWKQATAAKQFIDEMFDDEWSKSASLMLDYEEWEYEIDGKPVQITRADVISALSGDNVVSFKGSGHTGNASQLKTGHIRFCFDYFFYYTELMQQSIKNELFTLEDVRFPLGYYADKLGSPDLQKLKAAVFKYLVDCNYANSEAFFGQLGLVK